MRPRKTIKKLNKFFKQTKTFLNQPKQNEGYGYMRLYHILHISKALTQSDEEIAGLMFTFIESQGKKFRPFMEGHQFHEMIEEIKNNTQRVIFKKPEAGPGSGTNIDKYLDHLDNILTIPTISIKVEEKILEEVA